MTSIFEFLRASFLSVTARISMFFLNRFYFTSRLLSKSSFSFKVISCFFWRAKTRYISLPLNQCSCYCALSFLVSTGFLKIDFEHFLAMLKFLLVFFKSSIEMPRFVASLNSFFDCVITLCGRVRIRFTFRLPCPWTTCVRLLPITLAAT